MGYELWAEFRAICQLPLSFPQARSPLGTPPRLTAPNCLQPHTEMKSLLPLLLFIPTLSTSCSSLPQEEIDALVTFREGEIAKLNEHISRLTADVSMLGARIMDIDARIEDLKEEKAHTMAEKATVEGEIKATQDLIEENQDRLNDLLDD